MVKGTPLLHHSGGPGLKGMFCHSELSAQFVGKGGPHAIHKGGPCLKGKYDPKGKGKGKHKGKHGLPPHVLAASLRSQGRAVPGFLLEPHEPGHIPPHTVLSTLVEKVEQMHASSDTLQLVRRDWWGYYHPAFEPHDPRHLPPHVIAFRLHQEVDEIECGAPPMSETDLTAAMLHEGHVRAPPHVLAQQMQASGCDVPGFLLPPHDASHTPPHIAIAALATAMRELDPSHEALTWLVKDRWGEYHSICPPDDPNHVPLHMIALRLHTDLEAAGSAGQMPASPGNAFVAQGNGGGASFLGVRAQPAHEWDAKQPRPPPPTPEALAEKLRASGQEIPGFLLPVDDTNHVPPDTALADLTVRLREQQPTSELLALVTTSWWGSVAPAFAADDERHRPLHILALLMQEELAEPQSFNM